MDKKTIVNRYKAKMETIPTVNNYPADMSKGNFVTYCYGTFTNPNSNKDCSVLLEFDEGNPAQGIYLGLQLGDNTDDQNTIAVWEPITNIIKRDFALYWKSTSTANNRILEWDFKDQDKKRYWPLWIRLEDNEDIFKAIEYIEVMIFSLKAQGFVK